jgi:beta-glucanase (GH16 family)
MAHRRGLLLVVLICAIAPVAFASARTRALVTASRTSSGRQYVAAPGKYDITVRVGSPAGSQSVVVKVPQTARRLVFIPRSRRARLTFHGAIRRGLLRVSAVGTRFRPQVSFAVSRTTTKSTQEADRSSSGALAIAASTQYTKLVWSDEFGGRAGSAPSSSNWIHDVGAYGAGNNELETYTNSTSNASVDGQGHLAIVARRQTPTGPPGQVRSYSSARLETQGLFSASYGLIEARMQIPAGAGLWPAFWMLGDNITTVGWPACGEIDVMETIGKNPFTVYGTIHGPSGSTSYQVGSTDVSAGSLASGFHTYAVSWSPNSVTWLLDGTPYATVTPSNLAPGQTWVFNQPFHLLLNLAVGGNWAGPPNASTRFPATLLVDWVRVYQ